MHLEGEFLLGLLSRHFGNSQNVILLFGSERVSRFSLVTVIGIVILFSMISL